MCRQGAIRCELSQLMQSSNCCYVCALDGMATIDAGAVVSYGDAKRKYKPESITSRVTRDPES